MSIYCYASAGYDGNLVEVEVDIRRGIPGLEIVGLPDSAVKEARERVRVAVRNSGFSFPRDRILVNLAPADVRKEGSGFDLPIALAILVESGELPSPETDIVAVGELQLSGKLRAVRGVLSAVAACMQDGIEYFIVPGENAREARALDYGVVSGVSSLAEAARAMGSPGRGEVLSQEPGASGPEKSAACDRKPGIRLEAGEQKPDGLAGDFADIHGHETVKRALAIAAAGRHHVLLFGPPGSGKTLSAQRISTILPELSRKESLEVTRIHSLAALLGGNRGLINRPPLRSPHHSASTEGMIGGGRGIRPGEISLAHSGVLILDEVPEFRRTLLQSLREPLEAGRVEIVRAGLNCWFPADFQLILTANPCPCGNLGREEAVCICTRFEIERYWKKLGGALLDRIDLRVPVRPVPAAELLRGKTTSSAQLRRMVMTARNAQTARFNNGVSALNGKPKPAEISRWCALDPETTRAFEEALRSVNLSSRACHSILKVARTVADMEGMEHIQLPHLYEAVQFRRYGDGEFFF